MHFALLGISLTAVVAASLLQAQLLAFAAPYLNPLQLRVDPRPIYLTHGEGIDEPHRIEWLAAGSNDWQPAAVGGRRGSEQRRRYFRYATAIATAADRKDTATASMLALPLVEEVMRASESDEWEGRPPIRIRVVRVSLDPDSPRPLSEPSRTTQWEAAIIPAPEGRDGESRWSLVTLDSRRLNALPGTRDANAGEEVGSPSEVTP